MCVINTRGTKVIFPNDDNALREYETVGSGNLDNLNYFAGLRRSQRHTKKEKIKDWESNCCAWRRMSVYSRQYSSMTLEDALNLL